MCVGASYAVGWSQFLRAADRSDSGAVAALAKLEHLVGVVDSDRSTAHIAAINCDDVHTVFVVVELEVDRRVNGCMYALMGLREEAAEYLIKNRTE